MGTIPSDVDQQAKQDAENLKKLFVIEEKILLTEAVLQQALHEGRGVTADAFVYKRLIAICKNRITSLNKERQHIVAQLVVYAV